MNQYVKQYQKTHIETASSEKIMIMLYEGAIQFLNQAKIAIENKDIEGAHNGLIGAQNIINEFINTLNPEPNPELAENLRALYEYFVRRLIEANIKKKIEPIDEVLGFLKDLKATWEQAILIAQKEAESGNKSVKKEEEKPTKSQINIKDEDDEEDEDEDDDEDDEDEEDEGRVRGIG